MASGISVTARFGGALCLLTKLRSLNEEHTFCEDNDKKESKNIKGILRRMGRTSSRISIDRRRQTTSSRIRSRPLVFCEAQRRRFHCKEAVEILQVPGGGGPPRELLGAGAPNRLSSISRTLLPQICQIYDGARFLGTGFLYKEKYVITAGHLFDNITKPGRGESELRRSLSLHFPDPVSRQRKAVHAGTLLGLEKAADVAVISLSTPTTSTRTIQKLQGQRQRDAASTVAQVDKDGQLQHSTAITSSYLIGNSRPAMGDFVFSIGSLQYGSEPILVQGSCVQPYQSFSADITTAGAGASSSQVAEEEAKPSLGNNMLEKMTQLFFNNNSTTTSTSGSSSNQVSESGQAAQTGTPRFLQLSLETTSGMSGSPVFSRDGALCGMLVKRFLDFGLALPADFLCPVADRIIRKDNKDQYYKKSLGMVVEPCWVEVDDKAAGNFRGDDLSRDERAAGGGQHLAVDETKEEQTTKNYVKEAERGNHDIEHQTTTTTSRTTSNEDRVEISSSPHSIYSNSDEGAGHKNQNHLKVDSALMVTHIDPYSAACDAGVSVGDILVRLDGESLFSISHLCEALWRGLPFNVETRTGKVCVFQTRESS
ncbi:unnamed protein product [Amoebophrya sp. A25]|nr:unnamed protein product [Amoebophrya sp. A25]|eukprot:GSA25T00004972001.1